MLGVSINSCILNMTFLSNHFSAQQPFQRRLQRGYAVSQCLKVSPQVRIPSPIDTQSLCIDQLFTDRPGSLDFVLSTSR